MTSISTLRLLLLAGLGPTLATASFAQDSTPDDHYFYLGLGAGESRSRIDEERITQGLAGNGLATTNFIRDQRGASYKLFGGYQINRYLGVEGGYFDLGKFGFMADTAPAGSLVGHIRVQGLNLDLVGALPIGDRFSILGRVGAQAARSRDSFSSSGAVTVLNPNPSQREVNVKFGAGLQYAFSPAFLMRAEAERYRINDAVGNHGGVNVLTVSLVFPIGRTSTAAPRMAQAPSEVAPAPMPPPAPPVVEPPPPAPAPAPVAAPAPRAVAVAPPRRRVSFSAESLFGFDQSTVKPEGRQALDKFASETRGTQFDVITVEGHTDRLGTTAYNQRLSAQRGEAVKAYLVSAGGFDASKINVVAKGESEPVTKSTDCSGNKASAKLIACLQPDRRVEIEVTGTR